LEGHVSHILSSCSAGRTEAPLKLITTASAPVDGPRHRNSPERSPADPAPAPGSSRQHSEADEIIAAAWHDYKANGSPAARERLILHYSPLVKFIAGRVAGGLPQSVEQADLVSYGVFGLIDAIDKFDPARGFKFETYAISRIEGAIIDELRSIDWVPRSVRRKARAVERAYSQLESELRRSPKDREVAAALDMSERDLAQVLAQTSVAGLVALDEQLSASSAERGGSFTVGDTIADASEGPVEAFELDEMNHLLAEAINRLPERDRLVLTLYYYEGLTLVEIAAVLGVTESRVCQIRTKAISWLRERMFAPEIEHLHARSGRLEAKVPA
jgi:RNA polymerase sigma factor for flagellar operon FliA